MFSVPVHAVPKPKTKNLRLVVDHLDGEFSPNSRIQKLEIGGVKLDGIRALGALLSAYRKHHPNTQLVVWNSKAYRLCLMHPLWQLKQVVALDGVKHIDRCNNFGGHASQKVFHSVASLVV
jgi:hypothetical protein